MPIAVVTACDPHYAELQKLTSTTVKRYCDRHGYKARISVYDKLERPASWYKLVEIQKAFNDGFDTVMWVDTDAIIVNMDKKIESLLREDKMFYYSNNWLGMNCGVMIMRDCMPIRLLLRMAWNQTQLINHSWWEQAALTAIIGHDKFPKELIMELPATEFNSEEYYGGCLVYHMPDTPMRERMRRFGDILGTCHENATQA